MSVGANVAAPVNFNMAKDDGSTSESDDEAFQRRRTNAKPFTIENLPNAAGLRPWWGGFQAKCCSSSNRSKKRTLKFIQRAMEATSVEECQKFSKKWEPLDTEIYTAIYNVATGSIGRELMLYREKLSRDKDAATGLAFLFLVLQRFETDRGHALQIDLEILQKHKAHGNLEEYIDGLDSKLSMLTKEPDPDLLMSLVEPQLRTFTSLGPEFVTFDRARYGTPERTLEFLIDAARQQIYRDRKLKNFQVQRPKDNPGTLAVVKHKGAPPAQEDHGPQGTDEHDNTNKVYIKNLSYQTSKEDVAMAFGECGEIESLDMPLDYSGSCRGFCFIKYTDKEGMENALRLNATEYGGRTIHVLYATGQPKGKRKGKGKGKE